jgi:XTP/dITP diphosphohydrolase
MKLVFATANQNKTKEIQLLLPISMEVLSLLDIHCLEEIPETQPTIEGNASQKAFYVYEKYHQNCFADDTGLEVEALAGRPGVYSARYAGEEKNANNNMDKILSELKDQTNRNARFKTVISLVIDGVELQFEGIVNGTILFEKRGSNGFGYDAIFAPHQHPIVMGETENLRSFAEMTLAEKNIISHRALAVNKLIGYLLGLDK